MSYSLIDYFKAFHAMKQQFKLSTSAQSVYFSILGEFNAARFPERLDISDRTLKALAGVKSVSTAHDAKRILKNLKLIDFAKVNGVTTYRLATEHLPNTNRTPAEQVPNTCRTGEPCSNSHACGDVRQEDFSSFNRSTRAREPSELEDALEYWEDELGGGKLSFEHQSQIARWVKLHGVTWVKAAMREASDANVNRFGVNFKLLRGVVDRKLNSKLKGGDKRGGVLPTAGQSTGQYDLRGTNVVPQWAQD